MLIDTHIAYWVVVGDDRLGASLARDLARAESISVSSMSIWEIAVKHAIIRRGARAMDISGHDAAHRFREAGFKVLDFRADHAAEIDNLPLHHGDPFDRGMLAQARVEGLTFLTRDAALERYGHPVRLV